MKFKILTTLMLGLGASYNAGAVNPVITIGGVTNFNALYGGAGIKYTVANATGNSNTINIQYGITSSYGSVTTNSVFTGPGSVIATNEIVGLSLNTICHYSVFVTDISGSTNSPDATFTNNAIGVVTYPAMINYVRGAFAGTNFNTNAYPYAPTNFNGIGIPTTTQFSLNSPTFAIISGAPLTNIDIIGVTSINGDAAQAGGLSAVVGSYLNTNYIVVAGATTNTIYTTGSTQSNSLFNFKVYTICTTSGGGTLSNLLAWQDEVGKHTNVLLLTPLGSTTTGNNIFGASTNCVIHATTNTPINFITSSASLTGSPVVNIFGTLERTY